MPPVREPRSPPLSLPAAFPAQKSRVDLMPEAASEEATIPPIRDARFRTRTVCHASLRPLSPLSASPEQEAWVDLLNRAAEKAPAPRVPPRGLPEFDHGNPRAASREPCHPGVGEGEGVVVLAG